MEIWKHHILADILKSGNIKVVIAGLKFILCLIEQRKFSGSSHIYLDMAPVQMSLEKSNLHHFTGIWLLSFFGSKNANVRHIV